MSLLNKRARLYARTLEFVLPFIIFLCILSQVQEVCLELLMNWLRVSESFWIVYSVVFYECLVKFYPGVHVKRGWTGVWSSSELSTMLSWRLGQGGSDSIFIPLWSKISLKTDNRKRGQDFTRIVLFQFVNTVEEMEKAVLVPQSLQDMSLSSSNGVVLEKSLFESFTVLRNIKNIVLTGMIFYVVVRYTLLCKITM